MRNNIAIIGAGLSGVVLLRALAQYANVTLFEKARGIGGRMSTRHAAPYHFDHGAPCFTAHSQAFLDFLRPYRERGIVTEWAGQGISVDTEGKIHSNYALSRLVASPTMNALCKELAFDLPVMLNTEVAPLLERSADGWHIYTNNGSFLGVYDWVISTAPPAQTARLFSPYLPAEANIHQTRLNPSYALMVGLARPWDQDWYFAKVRDGRRIKWITVNSSKPGRNSATTSLVAYSHHHWAQSHLEMKCADVKAQLTEQFAQVTGIDTSIADYVSLHRWRYATVHGLSQREPYIDRQHRLACVGDWCHTSNIEHVWYAAMELVRRLLPSL